MTGFGIDLGAMAQAITGINATVDVLNEFAPLGGHFTSTALDFASLRPSSDDCGDDLLGDAFEEFFERWQWGMRHLVKEGTEMVSALTDTKTVYEQAEEKAKQAIQLLVGNPAATADPTKQSWEELSKPYLEPSSVGEEWDAASKGLTDAWNSSVKDVEGAVDGLSGAGRKVGDLL